MIEAALPVALTLLVLGGATFAPWLLRHASPALVRAPRLAVALWSGSVAAWLLAVLAIGPMLLWITSGPAMLGGAAAEFCQRCLDLANPLAEPWIRTPVPALLLLALPTVLVALLVAGTFRSVRRRRTATHEAAAVLLAGATRARVAGYPAWRTPDSRPYAIAYPRRFGGIVVSEGALAVLDPEELAAVLTHEHAHLRQRHHAIRAALDAIALPLRRIPVVAAAACAVPHYLEIAADNEARRRVGTSALASALLKLGGAGVPAPKNATAVLHAAGPDRIRHLVAPERMGPGTSTASISVLMLVLLTAASAVVVYLPYLRVLATGCL